MREEKVRVVPQQVVDEYRVHYTEYRCDGCGRQVSREDHGDGYAHQLEVALDSDECVSFYRRRDFCPACLEPVWQAVNQLLGTDPDDERDRDYD